MKHVSAWFWIAIAYLVATVTYVLWTQWASFASYSVTDKLLVATNLGCKILAIGFLIYRRAAGVYFLAAAFVVGLSATISGYYVDGGWTDLPLPSKIGRVDGFVISLVIVLYMAVLMRRGVLSSRQDSN